MKNNNGGERTAADRREYIKKMLNGSDEPITAARFARELSVSRQIIVGDVVLLRASGLDILATPRGYIMNGPDSAPDFPFMGIIACKHSPQQLRDELYTIVDFGATVIDVSIEHAIYGEISAKLGLSSRYDVDQFISKVEMEKNSAPISSLTDGIHIHAIGCRDRATFDRIKGALSEKGILIS